MQPSAIRTTSSSDTTPWIVQPNAVATPACTWMFRLVASRASQMRRTSATISSGVRRTLARLWPSLADTGTTSMSAPASIAASAPFTLGTSADTFRSA